VQVIRHRRLIDAAIRKNEPIRHAHEPRMITPGALAERLIHLQHHATQRIDRQTARRNVQHQHLRVRTLRVQQINDGRDAADDQFAAVTASAGVVGADHQHDHLGVKRRQRCLLQSPQHMLGAITAHADLQGAHRLEVALPRRGARVFPTLRDAVAHEHHVHWGLCLAHAAQHLVLSRLAAVVAAWGGRQACGHVAFGRLGRGGGLGDGCGGWRLRGSHRGEREGEKDCGVLHRVITMHAFSVSSATLPRADVLGSYRT